MNCDGKKISFGFSRVSKKPNVFTPAAENNTNVELIDCLEGTEIKVRNAVETVQKTPLVIPIKGDANSIVSQIERESLKNKKIKTETSNEDTRPDSELTIEELAARQLLKEARSKLLQSKDTTKVHTLPLDESSAVEDGAEPSMNDYENVPIEDFGLACLRGMGWKEGMSIGKNQSKFVKPPEPDLRPKGLGLGAQKILDIQAKDVFDQNGKKLVLAKGAFAKIVVGLHKGKYCEVQFCDEWSGRVGVKISNVDEILTLNELFVVPISKEEYIRESKVINSLKYEQYKMKKENIQGSHSNSISEERIKINAISSDDDFFQNTEKSIDHKKSKHKEKMKHNKKFSIEKLRKNKLRVSSDSSEDTSDEHFSIKSRRRHRSRSRSPSGSSRKYVEQNQKNKLYKHINTYKEKRKEERNLSSDSSDDQKKRNDSKKYTYYEEKFKSKKKSDKKSRDTSSESDYSTQKSRRHGNKSKSQYK